MPILLVISIVMLLEVLNEGWYDQMLNNLSPYPSNTYKNNLGPLTDPYYYNKEEDKEVNGAPVLYYKRIEGGYKKVLTTTIDCPIDWKGDNFTWIWISEAKRCGWEQDKPPADAAIIASTAMWAHIDRILSAEQGVETGSINSLSAYKKVKNTTKSV